MSQSVLVTRWCPTLCDPVDCSPPGFSVHGIPQARILEWVATSFSRGSSPPRDRTCVSCIGPPGKPNIRKGIPWTNRAWQATVRGVAKTWTQLSTHAFMFTRLLKKEMTQEQHRKERPCRMWGGRAVPLSVHSPQISEVGRTRSHSFFLHERKTKLTDARDLFEAMLGSWIRTLFLLSLWFLPATSPVKVLIGLE